MPPFFSFSLACFTFAFAAQGLGVEPTVSEPVTYTGICGASAAMAVGPNHFIVADDEANRLYVYQRDAAGAASQVIDLTAGLDLERHAPETDIEGAARLGEKIFWITSHSRNHQGKEHSNRCRVFATTLEITNGIVSLHFVGHPYKNLLRDLVECPALTAFNLANAARLPPKEPGALNIEALCATPNNRLLIGFRNPVPHGKALLVPLENPEAILFGVRARLGPPLQLDLNGLGIRDMAFAQDKYLIIAGPYDGVGKAKLFSWSGGEANPRHLKEIDLKGFNAEAMVIYNDVGLRNVQLLSDDSAHQLGRFPCKELNENARHFRSLWVAPDSKHHKSH